MFEIELFLSAFAVLFVIIDPPGCAPIFATLTQNTSRKHQNTMAIKSVAVGALILFGFAYAGEFLFSKLGISLILKARTETFHQELAILAALGTVLFITLLAFLIAGPLMRLMGKTFTDILTRILGVLLATLAAQFVLDGIKGALF